MKVHPSLGISTPKEKRPPNPHPQDPQILALRELEVGSQETPAANTDPPSQSRCSPSTNKFYSKPDSTATIGASIQPTGKEHRTRA